MKNTAISNRAAILILILAMAGAGGCAAEKEDLPAEAAEAAEAREEKPAAGEVEESRPMRPEEGEDVRAPEIIDFMVTEDDNLYKGLVSDENDAMDALDALAPLLRINDARQEFKVENKKIIDASETIYEFRQYHEGIPVINGILSMQTDGKGEILSIRGDYKNITGIDANAKLSQDGAVSLAEEYLKEEGLYIEGMKASCGGLKIYGGEDWSIYGGENQEDQDSIYYEVKFSQEHTAPDDGLNQGAAWIPEPARIVIVDAAGCNVTGSRTDAVY